MYSFNTLINKIQRIQRQSVDATINKCHKFYNKETNSVALQAAANLYSKLCYSHG